MPVVGFWHDPNLEHVLELPDRHALELDAAELVALRLESGVAGELPVADDAVQHAVHVGAEAAAAAHGHFPHPVHLERVRDVRGVDLEPLVADR